MNHPTIIPPRFIGKPEDYPQNLSPEEVRSRFLDLLGPFEQSQAPLNLRVIEEQRLDDEVICQKVEYAVGPDEIGTALHLFRENLAKDAPGVLAIHGHGEDDIFSVGKAYHCQPKRDDPMQYGYRAALAGFRVLAPDALCFGERQARWGYGSGFMDEINTHAELCSRGRSLLWKSIWDNSRAIEALEYLGARRIGSVGWSGGSTQNYLLAAVNPKISAAACFFSFVTLRHQFYQYRLVHCLYHYVPGMVAAGIDWDQVVALAAPRKLFFGWGALDEGTPEVMYRAFVSAIRHRCQHARLPDSLVVHEELKRGHEVTEAMLTRALEFLREGLET